GRNRANSFAKFIRFISEVLFAKSLGIKVIWTVHNLWDHERRDPQLEVFFNRFLVRIYDQLIVHCSLARKSLLQRYQLPDHLRDKINVIPHGNYINSYANHVTRKKARTWLGLGYGDIVFLYFGTIRPYKGVQRMTDAFRKLNNPRARLLIVGEPNNEAIRSELIRFCESDERIRAFLKFVPDEDIQLYMNAADVVVLPFQNILTSGSALLAMSFGKPIIVPRLGCIPEVVDKEGGFLFNHDEGQGLLSAMKQASLANLASMGEYNYAKAKSFDWNMIAEKTHEVYQL
ncbi:MAG: glycosyltransferase, partial [Candidatus Hodarchaeota archaeon]